MPHSVVKALLPIGDHCQMMMGGAVVPIDIKHGLKPAAGGFDVATGRGFAVEIRFALENQFGNSGFIAATTAALRAIIRAIPTTSIAIGPAVVIVETGPIERVLMTIQPGKKT